MKKILALFLTMALTFASAATVFAAEVQAGSPRTGMNKQESVEWALNEYKVSRIVTDRPDSSEAVYNENDLVATGTLANDFARASSWKAYHGNNSRGIPYGRLTNTTKVNMCIYGFMEYSNGEAIMHNEPTVYSKDHTHTISLIDEGTGGYGSGYSRFYYYIDDSLVHESTDRMWFSIN